MRTSKRPRPLKTDSSRCVLQEFVRQPYRDSFGGPRFVRGDAAADGRGVTPEEFARIAAAGRQARSEAVLDAGFTPDGPELRAQLDAAEAAGRLEFAWRWTTAFPRSVIGLPAPDAARPTA